MPARLIVEAGTASPPVCELNPEKVVSLGRNKLSHVILRDHHASRLHAQIFHKDLCWYLRNYGGYQPHRAQRQGYHQKGYRGPRKRGPDRYRQNSLALSDQSHGCYSSFGQSHCREPGGGHARRSRFDGAARQSASRPWCVSSTLRCWRPRPTACSSWPWTWCSVRRERRCAVSSAWIPTIHCPGWWCRPRGRWTRP